MCCGRKPASRPRTVKRSGLYRGGKLKTKAQQPAPKPEEKKE